MTSQTGSGGPATPSRAASTREVLLRAAREVFTESGFVEASIADVVRRAGASVGSLYHHFGGKADLYLALFEDYQSRQESRAAEAVRHSRDAGQTEPFAQFLDGARAYLLGCWEDRELARMFLDGDGPPGFELFSRRRYREWVRRNTVLLDTDEGEPHGTLVIALTSVVAETGREVAVADGEAAALRLVDEVVALLARLG